MTVKRINLYFDLSREEDKKAYSILSNKRKKTDYIIDLILASRKKDDARIKQLVKEIIEEYNFIPSNKENTNIEEKSSIPDDIFDFFEQM